MIFPFKSCFWWCFSRSVFQIYRANEFYGRRMNDQTSVREPRVWVCLWWTIFRVGDHSAFIDFFWKFATFLIRYESSFYLVVYSVDPFVAVFSLERGRAVTDTFFQQKSCTLLPRNNKFWVIFVVKNYGSDHYYPAARVLFHCDPLNKRIIYATLTYTGSLICVRRSSNEICETRGQPARKLEREPGTISSVVFIVIFTFLCCFILLMRSRNLPTFRMAQ